MKTEILIMVNGVQSLSMDLESNSIMMGVVMKANGGSTKHMVKENSIIIMVIFLMDNG